MGRNFITVIQISVVLGIPQYGPVGQYYCRTGDYYFATSFYTKDKKRAERECEEYNCDLIVEWSRKSYYQTYIGYDLRKFDEPACPQNQEMPTKIFWQKDFGDYMNSNHTINGEINFDRPVKYLFKHPLTLPKI